MNRRRGVLIRHDRDHVFRRRLQQARRRPPRRGSNASGADGQRWALLAGPVNCGSCLTIVACCRRLPLRALADRSQCCPLAPPCLLQVDCATEEWW